LVTFAYVLKCADRLKGRTYIGILLKVTIRWLQFTLTISMDEFIVFAMRRLELETVSV
jgi:hypothetical protein